MVRRDADQVALIASIARETPAQEVKWPRWQRSCDMRYEDKTRQPQHVTWIEAELNGVQPRRWAASDHRRHGRGRSSHIAYGPSSRSHGRLIDGQRLHPAAGKVVTRAAGLSCGIDARARSVPCRPGHAQGILRLRADAELA